MNRIHTLEDLFLSRLEGIHVTNTQTTIILPAVAQQISNLALRNQLASYFRRSREQNERIERILSTIGWSQIEGLHNAASGLMQDMSELLDYEEMRPEVMDAALLANAQRLQHHHIADYGCLRNWATLLGYDEAASQLQVCLEEEMSADAELTKLANSAVNPHAAAVYEYVR